ncbi:Replicative DNA helicase [Pseudolycoriella hygida]|uniref:Replicative DNA helicase n=1 Tax=Pseudolycoriella hygida TaxID=35572 RepID=A0A9Q0S6D0_9DIPT|nr:Replicative DNA helicase [Pseudolycoriella hygida]
MLTNELANNDLSSVMVAEQKVLGTIIVNQNNIERIEDFLRAEHFSIELHQEIYRTFLKLIDTNIKVTPTTVKNLLENNFIFQEAGGQKYLTSLITLAFMVIDIYDYGRIVYDAAIKRQLITISQETIKNAGNASIIDDAKTQVETLESKIYSLTNEDFVKRSFTNLSQITSEVLKNIDQIVKNPGCVIGIPTGFIDLDSRLGGFRNSDLVILAGRPSMGKTAFALNLAINACSKAELTKTKQVVGFFSLEMSSVDLVARVIAMWGGVDSTRFIDGKLNEENYNKIRQTVAEVNELPLFIDDSPALTISAIRSRARKLKRQNNLSILFIDYLQLIKCTEKVDNRSLEVAEITRSLKALAKELNIPVIALSQLSRAVEQRVDKRPILSDLRESGSIEQDADIVMFIYREEYYLKAKEPQINTIEHKEWIEKLNKSHNVAEIIITKHRKGPTGNVKLYYDDKLSKFSNITFSTTCLK